MHEDKDIDKLIRVLMKDTNERTSMHNVPINDFIKKVEWFEENKIAGADLIDLSALVTYEHYSPGEAIFKFGQPNDKMYIIIDGQVDFCLDMKKHDLNSDEIKEVSTDLKLKEFAN